ncbi:hypothetical protein SASPL_148976 [Salvia splendens]|uniref:DUF8003 domain-containing protein n=1 Tax=Salvia splendens TaxID=180675 RepID=A0A8X8WAC1_SALSN|nr:hypothetical protein SASPL_148976 [Salvia splendens]
MLSPLPAARRDDYSHRYMANCKLRFALSPHVLVGLAAVLLLSVYCNPRLIAAVADSDSDLDSGSFSLLFHQDYSPPAPPPPPPHQPSLSCESDLGGVGSLDTTCQIVSSVNITKNVYVEGKGDLVIAANVTVDCSSFAGCELAINISGNFTLGEYASIVCGAFQLFADNAFFGNGSAVNTTGLAGSPPAQTSGTPQGVDGAGGGHGGRGAACLKDKSKNPEDVWGGDAYSWSSLGKPCSYGSKGGTTSKEIDHGGGGGGKIMVVVSMLLEVNGSVLASGGDAGPKGGGGSGGSIYIKAQKMPTGRPGSQHDDPVISVYGGSSVGCPENAGAAGTFYDCVPRSLTKSGKGVRSPAVEPCPEFELVAEELLMSDSMIRVYGALRMSVKMFLMWNSKMLIDGGADETVETSSIEASNLIVLRNSSVIHSNANLGVHGQGLLNLTGPGDCIEAQRLVLSLFYSINIGPGSVLRGPMKNSSDEAVAPKLYCDSQDCPSELLYPPEDCNLNSSLIFTLQICRVEDILVEGFVEGSVVHFHRARTINVQPSGVISTSGMGCHGGLGQGDVLSNGLGSGGGHGGRGGMGCYDDICVDGGISYGYANLPCELGSGSGSDSLEISTAGGGTLVMGSLEHPLINLYVEGSVRADGDSFVGLQKNSASIDKFVGPGGGSGGTILLFLHNLDLRESGNLSSAGGHGSLTSGGGGGGGRIHFHWGGLGGVQGHMGENGSISGKACPKGLYGIFCEECPIGTYKNVTGSEKSLCFPCPTDELPNRSIYVHVRGGITETPCPYKCISDRYHMPNCYTALEELIYTFGGPWLFGLLLLGLLVLLASVLSVARMKFIGVDELPGPSPTQQGSQIDHSFPFLESLNEVLETNRVGESQSHVHRMYFMGPNTFSEPWYLPHTPPEQVKEIVYEGAFNDFVDEINALSAYQWWEGAVHSIFCILAYPCAWSWQQWRRKIKLQKIREYVRSEYDHSCLRSCRSRALYEGLKVDLTALCVVAATPDLMLAYIDFFLGGDEKKNGLPPRLQQRFPISLLFGGDGSYMTPFILHNDNIITSLMSQSVPPTTWYRFVAGVNAQLRLVRRGCLRTKFHLVLQWLNTFANPELRAYGLHVDLAWFQATTDGYYHYGLLIYSIEEFDRVSFVCHDGESGDDEQHSRAVGIHLKDESSNKSFLGRTQRSAEGNLRRNIYGGVLDYDSLKALEEKRDLLFILSFLIHNTKPVGHQDLVGLVISILLLGDFSLVLLTLLQLYSLSLADVFLVLFIVPLGILLPFPAGINALFSHGPRRSAGLARAYALDEREWWIFPLSLSLCKCIQSKLVNWHVANLEIQDRALYSKDFELFWNS